MSPWQAAVSPWQDALSEAEVGGLVPLFWARVAEAGLATEEEVVVVVVLLVDGVYKIAGLTDVLMVVLDGAPTLGAGGALVTAGAEKGLIVWGTKVNCKAPVDMVLELSM
jgi:hypothetical protein